MTVEPTTVLGETDTRCLCPLWRALLTLVSKGWAAPPDARLRTLASLNDLGYATRCGQLFHPTPLGRHVAAKLREGEQADLFDEAA